MHELEVTDVVNGDHGGVDLPPVAGEAGDVIAEEVVARDDDEVVVDLLLFDDESDVADRTEAIVVRRRPVVDHGHVALGTRPLLEVRSELGIRDDDRLVQVHRLQPIEDVVEHRPPPHLEERLGLVERERVEPGGIAGGEHDGLHAATSRARRG